MARVGGLGGEGNSDGQRDRLNNSTMDVNMKDQ